MVNKSKNLRKILKNLKNSLFFLQNNNFFFKEFLLQKRRKKKKLFSYFCQLRRLVFDQSSPVQPVSDFKGGPLHWYSELRTSDLFDDPLAYPGFGLGENMIFPKYELMLYFLVEHNF